MENDGSSGVRVMVESQLHWSQAVLCGAKYYYFRLMAGFPHPRQAPVRSAVCFLNSDKRGRLIKWPLLLSSVQVQVQVQVQVGTEIALNWGWC